MMMRMIQRMTLHNSRLLKLAMHKEGSCETLQCCADQSCGTNIPFKENENKLSVVFIANFEEKKLAKANIPFNAIILILFFIVNMRNGMNTNLLGQSAPGCLSGVFKILRVCKCVLEGRGRGCCQL